MAALTIQWRTVESITKPASVVVTGEDATEEEESSEKTELKWTDKPILVFVCDETEVCEGIDKLNDIILKDEKIALGMRAFRTVKMDPEQVEADAMLTGHGTEVPRMILVDPAKMKVSVVEKSKLKASGLFSAMKKVAGKFWKEKLETVVKDHLKMLTEQDKLSNADKTLADKETRAADDEKKLEKVKKERAEIRAELDDLSKAQRDLWKLTPKAAKKTA